MDDSTTSKPQTPLTSCVGWWLHKKKGEGMVPLVAFSVLSALTRGQIYTALCHMTMVWDKYWQAVWLLCEHLGETCTSPYGTTCFTSRCRIHRLTHTNAHSSSCFQNHEQNMKLKEAAKGDTAKMWLMKLLPRSPNSISYFLLKWRNTGVITGSKLTSQ